MLETKILNTQNASLNDYLPHFITILLLIYIYQVNSENTI